MERRTFPDAVGPTIRLRHPFLKMTSPSKCSSNLRRVAPGAVSGVVGVEEVSNVFHENVQFLKPISSSPVLINAGSSRESEGVCFSRSSVLVYTAFKRHYNTIA